MARDTKDKGGSSEQALIRELATLLDETGLSEIEIERSGLKVRVARNIQLTGQIPAPAFAAQALPLSPQAADNPASSNGDQANHPGAVKSPMVGTVYLAPEPGAAQFVDVGSTVSEGQTLLIIEAMKTMNHIPAPKAGVVKQLLVENGHPVEFGEPLLIIE
jgi:acetyl-CoA carboxylase biotin carboxyl carrier protein